MSTPQTLTRPGMRTVLRRHKGSQAELARRAGVGRQVVHEWLKYGKPSPKVQAVAETFVKELLAQEGKCAA